MDRDQKIILSQTAAEYLAAATLDLFPGALLLGGRGTSRYFYYDFLISSSISKESLTLIEERLIYLIKTEPKVKKREIEKPLRKEKGRKWAFCLKN